MVENVLLDPYRLRQFVAVADRLNITRAAEDLHLSQQAVSSAIKNLERDLGVTLLERSGRRIALTKEGDELLSGARLLLDASQSLVRTTRTAGRGRGEHLTIGHTPTVDPDEIFELTAPVRRLFPRAAITTRQIFPDEISATLRSGTIDVALRRGSAMPDATAAAAILAYFPLSVAVAATHRLANRTRISLHELKEDVLILRDRADESFYSDELISLCRRAGFEPKVVANRMNGTPTTTSVIDTDYFTFVTTEPGRYHRGRTVVIPVEGNPLSPIQAMWLHHTTSRLRQAFIEHPRVSATPNRTRSPASNSADSPATIAAAGQANAVRRSRTALSA